MADSLATRVPARLLEALRGGASAITTSQPAATRLRSAFDETMSTEGCTHWRQATVLPVESWLASRWHQLLVEGVVTETLLNAAQQQTLWRASIAEHHKALPLGALDTLAGLAREAWQSLWLARGQQRISECGSSTDGSAFLRWVRSFERHLAQNGRLTSAQLPSRMEALVSDKALPVRTETLWLVDCKALEPAYRSLLEVLREAGCALEWIDSEVSASAHVATAASDDEELLACADWVRTRLQASPSSRLGVVVPGLADRRAEIERVFTAELMAPGYFGELPFAFSQGQPLERSSVAVTALLLLGWRLAPLSLEAVSTLLRSPHFTGAGSERLAAAELDAFELRPRLRLRPELSLAQMIAAVERSNRRPRLLNLLYRLRQLRDARSDSAQPGSFARWTDAFRGWLQAAGCTPLADASAAELQVWRAWDSALDEVATLDFDSAHQTPPGANEAVSALARLVRAKNIASEQRPVSVEVLSPSELGGARFEALWFLGAHDQAWPEPVRPRPLLPWRLQNTLRMRGADREQDLSAARRLTGQIAASADEVVFSFARHGEDEERRISPLIAELALPHFADAPQLREHAPLALEEMLDDVPLPWISETEPVQGGSRILELQAACGFRAFAELRLWSKGIDAREPGMDARDRGTAVHTTMEEFWRRVVDQGALKQKDRADLTEILDECITIGLKRAEAIVESRWDEAYVQVQRERLHRLLGAWLDFEARRPPFAVLQQETALENFRVGGLTIAKLRADRIDETDGGLLLIDYKTGDADPSAWRSNRPDQPQLPLYATALNASSPLAEPLSGVAFALLRAGEAMKLTGFSDHPRVLVRSARMDEPTFEEQVQRWESVLAELADAFRTGRAEVDPKCYPETCAYCDQRLFCRIDASTLVSGEREEELEGAVDG